MKLGGFRVVDEVAVKTCGHICTLLVPAEALCTLLRAHGNGEADALLLVRSEIRLDIHPRTVASDCLCCRAVDHEQLRRQELRVGGHVRCDLLLEHRA